MCAHCHEDRDEQSVSLSRRTSLASALVRDPDKAARVEHAEQSQEIVSAALVVDFVTLEQRFEDPTYRLRLSDKIPNGYANFFEAVVHTVLQIQDSNLSAQVARNLVGACRDD
jgi:hypothetical protein